jgi:membrane protein involved in colicin uptake
MAFAKRNDLNDRREAAENARKAMLERFKARPPADDPNVLAKQAERIAIAEAREKRRAEREAIRKAEEERLAAEKLAAELAELQRKEEEARRRAEAEALVIAAQKAARDLRYANRKTKKRR